MKKIIGTIILILSFLINKNVFSDEFSRIISFNSWSEKNNYIYRIGCDEEKLRNIFCYDSKDKSPLWLNKDANLKVKFYKNRWSLPEKSSPNFDTLLYYFYKYNFSHLVYDRGTYNWKRYEIEPNNKFYKFEKKLSEDNNVKKEMNKTALLSYLFYEDDKIVVDELSPKDRFGDFVNNDTKLRSMSMGKTMVSYVMGHAICEGYIDSVDSRLNDWPLVKNTLYEDQKLIDLLNMSAGDQKYVNRGNFKDGSEIDTRLMSNLMFKMRGLKKSGKSYNYNNIPPKLLLNYISFKVGDNYENLLKEIFQKKAKIKESVYFFKNYQGTKEYGILDDMFFATRYDYLRIAKAILDDWQNDTCVGKYLKTIYENRISKIGFKQARDRGDSFHGTKSYAGFFHTDYLGMKNRKVVGMSGYGGNEIIIDFERSRILVIHSIHQNYNWKKIARSVIKEGIN
jgi:hypothetical protein